MNRAEDQLIQGKDFTQGSLAEHIYVNCEFKNCNFTECMLRGTQFISCSFKVCNLSLPKMDGCRFQDVRLEDCKMVGVDFFKCDRRFFSLQAYNCFLQYCNFADMGMKKVSFKGSKLLECSFSGACLIEADFQDTDLSGTLFHDCDLSKSDFCGAANYSIDLRNNKSKKAKFAIPEAIGLLRSFDIELV